LHEIHSAVLLREIGKKNNFEWAINFGKYIEKEAYESQKLHKCNGFRYIFYMLHVDSLKKVIPSVFPLLGFKIYLVF